mgnify:FL=1
MLVRSTISNFMGIEKEISISCLANNKISRKNQALIKTTDEVNILKNIGVIGNNGSGKTSILKAIATIQTFITFPFRKSEHNNKDFIEQIKKLPEEILNQLLSNLNTLNLPSQNVNNSTKETLIELEFYISETEGNIPGYYTYTLKYDKNYKQDGVIEESLNYRKKYNSKKIIKIFTVNKILESEIGTKLLYKNNTISKETDNEMIKYYTTFGNEIMKKCEFIFNGEFDEYEINLISLLNKNKKRFVQLCNLADEKISDVGIEKNNNDETLFFINNKKNKLYFSQLSTGTQKIIVLGNKILNALENNKSLFIDELEKSLHPSLANFLIMLMEYPIENSYSQLFFTTHSIYLALLLDNDQLYYINNKKDNYEILNISTAIKQGIINKDKTLPIALVDDLLIKNPNRNKINEFLNKTN